MVCLEAFEYILRLNRKTPKKKKFLGLQSIILVGISYDRQTSLDSIPTIGRMEAGERGEGGW